jgi:imidazolonepropionase-like amidohydrolase
VRFAIAIPDDAFEMYTSNLRNLPYQAATAVAHGLPRDEAMRAITLYPAQILGIDDRVGSLQPGRDATLFIADGDPLEITTQVERAWIGGREIDLRSRHTRLYDKYRQKYPETRDPG